MTCGTGPFLAAGPKSEEFGAFSTWGRKKSEFVTSSLSFFIIKPILCFPALVLPPLRTINHRWHLWGQPGSASGNQHLLSGDLDAGLHWGSSISRHWYNWELQQAHDVLPLGWADTEAGAQLHRWLHPSLFNRSGH